MPAANVNPAPMVTDERFLLASEATKAEAVKDDTFTVVRLTVAGKDRVTEPVEALAVI